MKIDNCSFPEDLLYDIENFVWIRNKGEKTVTIGIMAIMASIAGKLSNVKLKQVGTKLEKGKSCGSLESTKYFGVIRTPLSGTIV
jgi:glycine cleavage system H protein